MDAPTITPRSQRHPARSRSGRGERFPGELIAGFRAGDRRCLGALYRAHAPAVWAVAFAVLGDRTLADDSVQETFVRVWRAADRFDPTRPIEPWLFSIARRAALDVRRREMRPTRGDHAPEVDVAVTDDGVDEAWQRWEVTEALTRLSTSDRRLMRLLHLEGYTQQQVAELLEVPVGTVKSRSYRAHRRLAGLLAHLRSDHPEPLAVAC